jgi:hypothetical protein
MELQKEKSWIFCWVNYGSLLFTFLAFLNTTTIATIATIAMAAAAP